MLFYFNTKDAMMTQTLGLTDSPVGIVTDDAGNLYLLDSNYNQVFVYQRTFFVDIVHQAVTLYNDGKYIESKPIWEEILRQNTSFALAHSALGTALAKEGRYQEALQEFYDAKDYGGYSAAYWEIRNQSIQKNLTKWIITLVVAFILLKIAMAIFKASSLSTKFKAWKESVLKHKLVHELVLSTTILKKPQDLFYYIKRKNLASYASGFIVLMLFVIVTLIDTYGRGFLFQNTSRLNSVLIEITMILGIFFLFVIVNYLISSLSDGEGRFKDVFIASCYALLPIIIFTLPMTLISHILTYNESFIIQFYYQIVYGWTLILLVVSIQGIHNYRIGETIRNIILILFGMAIIILIGLLIYTFMGQMIDFVTSVIKEVIYRV
jgi:tetratricopeptide (TPR) repeat protein